MICLYPEQLASQLQDSLKNRYLIWGNEPLLIQESEDAIRKTAKSQGFKEHFTFSLEQHTDWNEIFHLCKTFSLFSTRQLLKLILPENGPNISMAGKLTQLSQLLHSNLLLLLCGKKITKIQEKSDWFKALSFEGVYISCSIPEYQQLPKWVTKRAHGMKLILDAEANQLLCHCYEGNLLALSQVLTHLSLLFPDGKLTLSRVESVVNDSPYFMPHLWIDAMLEGKLQRAWHILKHLEQENIETIILLRSIQRTLMLLLTLKRQSKTISLKLLLDQYKIWKNRRFLLISAFQRLSLYQLQSAFRLLMQIELNLKKDFSYSVWLNLQSLTTLICANSLPRNFIYTL
ncbi:DNA polymerase III subunit delta [Candidatus Hartigia pinicola]|nr:DNA polymerase III subunit delta [Candidatus Hartigia pinicola]